MKELEAMKMLQEKLTCMTLEDLSCIEKGCDKDCDSCNHNYGQGTIGEQKEALSIAINALEEIQQYREIGKPKEIKQKLEELERWHTYRLAINVKNPFAKMSTSICHNCDHKDEYIEKLEAEIEEYKAIGDFAELVEKWCWKHQHYNQDDLNELMEIAEQLKGGGVNE